MGVFLRWGVFGILAVAALVYAYNASKSLAEKRGATPAPVVSQEEPVAGGDEEAEDSAEVANPVESAFEEEPELPAACEEERQVAERVLKYRRDGEPFDRVLRMHQIAFQDDAQRRERLEAVARHWYERQGRDPNAAGLRQEVLRDCRKSQPPHETSPLTPAPQGVADNSAP